VNGESTQLVGDFVPLDQELPSHVSQSADELFKIVTVQKPATVRVGGDCCLLQERPDFFAFHHFHARSFYF
jgi:hypothetical protein